MANARPKPPELRLVVDEISRQLAALGAIDETIDGKVYELYVAQWRELKRCPKHHDMAMELGITGSTLDGALNRLARDGRMIHVRRGVWLPKVV